jgi:hypothetical protein
LIPFCKQRHCPLSFPNAHSTCPKEESYKRSARQTNLPVIYHHARLGPVGVELFFVFRAGVPKSDHEPRSERVRSISVNIIPETSKPLHGISI